MAKTKERISPGTTFPGKGVAKRGKKITSLEADYESHTRQKAEKKKQKVNALMEDDISKMLKGKKRKK